MRIEDFIDGQLRRACSDAARCRVDVDATSRRVRRFFVLCLLSFVLPAVAAPTNLSPATTAAAYCVTLGITDEQIETFRKEMLIGYGEPTYWIEEPKYVIATRTKFNGEKATETQYTGFETKKGLWYTWGKDGVGPTGWTQADGTPLELAKPAGAGWKLMVRKGEEK